MVYVHKDQLPKGLYNKLKMMKFKPPVKLCEIYDYFQCCGSFLLYKEEYMDQTKNFKVEIKQLPP